ncbi:MAG: polymer-forming cytoskeletal protein [Anaerolineaceae bacterium]|nr:polymer-forming cytoskeletal protein [Anaerolineaceae bacterium]
MKNITRILITFFIVSTIIFAFPTQVFAQTPDDDGGQVVLGGTYRLSDNETLDGDLVVLGGKIILEEGSLVTGDIFLAGGSLIVSGTVHGEITAAGSHIELTESAWIKGDLNIISSSLEVDSDATIQGVVNESTEGFEFDFDDPDMPYIPDIPIINPAVRFNSFDWVGKYVGNILWSIVQALALSALAALLVLIAQKPTERVAKSIVNQPFVSGGIGLLTLIVTPALVILLAITIILIPISLIAALLLGLGILFGWMAIGFEIGKRLASMLKQTWADPISAGLGTLVLSLVAFSITWIPILGWCLGWVLPAIVGILGLGGVLISRFGTNEYIPAGKTDRDLENIRSSDNNPEKILSDNADDQNEPPLNIE